MTFVLNGVELKISLGATLIFRVERAFSWIFLVFPRDQCRWQASPFGWVGLLSPTIYLH